MTGKYCLLLLNDVQNLTGSYAVCGTYCEGLDDPSVLRNSSAHACVDAADYFLAQEPGEWRFSSERGLYKP